MKILSKIVVACCMMFCFSFYTVDATCTQNNKCHVDHNVTRCPYKQEDIKQALKKNIEIYNNIGINNVCFYCGCPIEKHTKKEPIE